MHIDDCVRESAGEQMDGTLQLWIWIVVLGALGLMILKSRPGRRLRLPPGPRAWPVVGCLLSLPKLNPPEVLFAKLAETYGELMLVRMGARSLVVVSSARMAMEFLKTHDQEFANRPERIMFEYISFSDTQLLVISSTNPLFKPTRRMFAAEILSPRKVVATADVRKEQVHTCGSVKSPTDLAYQTFSGRHTVQTRLNSFKCRW